jgi:hypothetical protein
MYPDWLKSQQCSEKKTNGKIVEFLEPIYNYDGRNHILKLNEQLIKGFSLKLQMLITSLYE